MMYQKEPKRIVPVLFVWQKTLILVAFYSSRLRYGCSIIMERMLYVSIRIHFSRSCTKLRIFRAY